MVYTDGRGWLHGWSFWGWQMGETELREGLYEVGSSTKLRREARRKRVIANIIPPDCQPPSIPDNQEGHDGEGAVATLVVRSHPQLATMPNCPGKSGISVMDAGD